MSEEILKSVWVVTHSDDYEIVKQWVYDNEESADSKNTEMQKKLFEHLFDDLDLECYEDEFTKESSFMDYQLSSAWWDQDCRITVYIAESNVNSQYYEE